MCNADADDPPETINAEPDADVDVLAAGSTLNEIPASFITITLLSNLSSFNVETDFDDADPNVILLRIRGFRPLSRTFFLALIPTQSTSCFIASRSETSRLGAVRRMVPVLVLGRVAYGEWDKA